MLIRRRWRYVLSPLVSLTLLAAAPLAVSLAALLPGSAFAQQSAAAPATPAKPKPKPITKPSPKPGAKLKPAAKPAESAKPAVPPAMGGVQPKLLGQYADWGAYTASPGGKKVCFAIAKPASSQTVPPNRPRNPIYMFISTRPAEKVTNEISIIIGYPFKSGADATATVGSASFPLYTQQDGAWIKNSADEANMVSAMRSGQTAVIKGVSTKGTQSSDTFGLKGLSQALDRVGQECK
jgi:Invasion associated locus B (IalB) protein